MQSDNLYSVSWYKDNEHIYIWSRKPNKKQTFAVEGVKIDVSVAVRVFAINFEIGSSRYSQLQRRRLKFIGLTWSCPS